MNKRGKIIIGNWKLNGSKQLVEDTLLELGEVINQSGKEFDCSIAICSPAIYTNEIVQLAARISDKLIVGCKNINTDPHTFTGELTAHAAKTLGTKLCLVGHGERHSTLNEGNYSNHLKIKQLIDAGITPALCIGEKLEDQLAGNTYDVLYQQLTQSLNGIELNNHPLYIVYEPAYEASSCQRSTAIYAQPIHAAIRQILSDILGANYADNTSIIYGGSVNHDNALELINQSEIDGLLIGCVNANLPHFRTICKKVFSHSPVFSYSTESKEFENSALSA